MVVLLRQFSCLILAIGLSASICPAADLQNVITDVSITSWNEKDGLPASAIVALAQDAEGYLWVGTTDGLFRFDGFRFSRWESFAPEPLPGQFVRALYASKNGTLWVGFGDSGGVVAINHNRLISGLSSNGLTNATVWTIAEDAEGVMWAGGDNGLFRLLDNQWVSWTASHGIPPGAVYSVFKDRAGNVFIAHATGVFKRSVGTDEFNRIDDSPGGRGELTEMADGGVWVTDPIAGYRPLQKTVTAHSVARQGRGVRLLPDRKNNLWIGTGGQGLWRVRDASSHPDSDPERANSLTGLLGDGVYALIEDRDGNIWAGTTEGLNRVTYRTIDQVIDLGLVRSIDVDRTGHIWVATIDELIKFTSITNLETRTKIPIRSQLRAMTVAGSTVWFATNDGVFLDSEGSISRLEWPADLRVADINSLTTDGLGGAWITTTSHALLHWRNGRTRRISLSDDVAGAVVTVAFTDAINRAWFAFDNGHVVRVDPENDSVSSLAVPPDARFAYRSVFEDESGGIWLGGDGGLTRFSHDHFVTLKNSSRFPIPTIAAIAADSTGSLWLGTTVGVVHIDSQEFDLSVADRVRPVRYTLYNRSDGIAGTPLSTGPDRRVARAADGRLWFLTTRGISVLNPTALGALSSQSPVRLEGATADDRRFFPGDPITLPPGTRKLEINYTAVRLTAPLKTKFRYRLEPFDRDWVDAGSRRQAFYTNIPPGRYRFSVSLAEAQPRQADDVANWDIAVAPRFYQTTTFAITSVLAVGLMAFGTWRLRERQLRKQFTLLLAERARLGREIHDTLLQGLVGTALQFDGLAHELSSSPRMHRKFLMLRDRLEEYIREARRSIWDLHHPISHGTVIEAIRRAGEFATDGQGVALDLAVTGTPVKCAPVVDEQLIKIAQEAILNAVRHASPKKICIELKYESANITLRITDDGQGFNPAALATAEHYGITSMQERATKIGGSIALKSSDGSGTEITAVLPFYHQSRGTPGESYTNPLRG